MCVLRTVFVRCFVTIVVAVVCQKIIGIDELSY